MKDNDPLIMESAPNGLMIISILIGMFLPLAIIFIMNMISGGALLGYDPIQTFTNFFYFVSELVTPTVDAFYLPLIYVFTGLIMGLVAIKWWKSLLASTVIILFVIISYIGLGSFVVGFPAIWFVLLGNLLDLMFLNAWLIVPSLIGSLVMSSVLKRKTCFSSDFK